MKILAVFKTLLLLTFVSQALFANDVTYIDTCGVSSSADNETLVVTSDIQANVSGSPCITISHENVTLECDGHVLTAPTGGFYQGILIEEAGDGVTVRNCKLSGWWFSILHAGDNGLIEDNRITPCGFGLFLSEASGNDILTNIIGLCSWDALVLRNSNGNLIRDNGIYENQNLRGIFLQNSDNNNIVDNRVGRNFMGILLFESSGNNLIDNVSKGHWESAGIRLENSHDNLVADCNASKNGIGIEEIGEDLNNIYEDNVCRNNTTAASNIEDACN